MNIHEQINSVHAVFIIVENDIKQRSNFQRNFLPKSIFWNVFVSEKLYFPLNFPFRNLTSSKILLSWASAVTASVTKWRPLFFVFLDPLTPPPLLHNSVRHLWTIPNLIKWIFSLSQLVSLSSSRQLRVLYIVSLNSYE